MKEHLQYLTNQAAKSTLEMVPLNSETSYIHALADELGQTVFEQDEALLSVASAVARAKAGLRDPDRPMLSAFFLGPTGVGKTETAHALSLKLFGERNSKQLKIVDCAQFANGHHTISRLVGAPPGYTGYGDKTIFTPQFLSSENIIVFDEIEKAAEPAFYHVLMSIIEEGRLQARVQTGTTPNGYARTDEVELNFANSIILMTSNIGASDLQKARQGSAKMGFHTKDNDKHQTLQEIGEQALKTFFVQMPEFPARVDEMVVFNDLTDNGLERVYAKSLVEMNEYLQFENGIQAPYIATTVEFRQHVLSGIDKQFGARDIRHSLDKQLMRPLADKILDGSLDNAEAVVVTYEPEVAKDEQLKGHPYYFYFLPRQEPENILPFPQRSSDNQEAEKKALPDSATSTGDFGDAGLSADEEKERAKLSPPYDDAGEEKREPFIPTEDKDAPVDEHRDRGDENDYLPPIRIGLQIMIWNEDKVDENGDADGYELKIRDLPIP